MRRHRVTRIATAVTVMTAAAVAVAVPGGSAGAVGDGTPLTTAPPWAAYITYQYPVLGPLKGLTHQCTGSIVADRWVLTAAHCTLRQNLTPFPANDIRITLGRDKIGTTGGVTLRADQVARFDNAASNDLALLRLDGPLPVGALPLPLAISGLALPDGTPTVEYGYGNTAETYNPAKVKKGGDPGEPVTSTPSQYLRLTRPGSYVTASPCDSNSWCMNRVGDSEVLHGDSGGPWMTDPANPAIIGVLHADSGFVATGPTTGFYTRAVAGSVTDAAEHDWAVQTAGIYTPKPGTVLLDNATGGTFYVNGDGSATAADQVTTNCLVTQGAPLLAVTTFDLAEVPKSTTPIACSLTPPPGAVYSFGYGSGAELGTGYTGTREGFTATPAPVDLLTHDYIRVAAADTAYAVRNDGTVMAWGNDSDGMLGNGDNGLIYQPALEPTPVRISNVDTMSATGFTALARTADGRVYQWGDVAATAPGRDSDCGCYSLPQPGPASLPAGVSAVAAGWDAAYALAPNGTVWAWGSNSGGQLGAPIPDGGTTTWDPVQVTGLTGITALAAGYGSAYALRNDGTVWAWGDNTRAELGPNGGSSSPAVSATPVQVTGLPHIAKIAASTAGDAYALDTTGHVWAWGDNSTGALGTGTVPARGQPTQSASPVQVTGLDHVTDVAAGGRPYNGFALAVRADHTLYSWGFNEYGELGYPTPNPDPSYNPNFYFPQPTPTQVTALPQVTTVTAGLDTSYATVPTP